MQASEQAAERRGDWMITYTGRRFWPLDPRPEDVDFRDIGHALSLICRYGGHVRRFYSVAEHSNLLARYFFDRQMMGAARLALIHDAPEAYVGDTIRPIKRSLWSDAGLGDIEARVWEAIGTRLGWSAVGWWNDEDMAPVHAADSRILANEARELFRPETRERAEWPLKVEPLPGVVPIGVPPHEAEREFIKLFHLLFPGVLAEG